jgi:hypothetical protein
VVDFVLKGAAVILIGSEKKSNFSAVFYYSKASKEINRALQSIVKKYLGTLSKFVSVNRLTFGEV